MEISSMATMVVVIVLWGKIAVEIEVEFEDIDEWV